MSRSYKRHPFVTDHHRRTTKENKRLANRMVRRRIADMDEDMPARLQHRKMTESYDICDYKWRMTKQEAIDWYEDRLRNGPSNRFLKRYPTLDAWLKYWDKCHRRK